MSLKKSLDLYVELLHENLSDAGIPVTKKMLFKEFKCLEQNLFSDLKSLNKFH